MYSLLVHKKKILKTTIKISFSIENLNCFIRTNWHCFPQCTKRRVYKILFWVNKKKTVPKENEWWSLKMHSVWRRDFVLHVKFLLLNKKMIVLSWKLVCCSINYKKSIKYTIQINKGTKLNNVKLEATPK